MMGIKSVLRLIPLYLAGNRQFIHERKTKKSMAALLERTLTPAEIRTLIDFDEAVLAEASNIMHYTREQLDFSTVSAGLIEAWRGRGSSDTYEAFVGAVFNRITHRWFANARHVDWFDEYFATEIELDKAVNEEVWNLTSTPVEALIYMLVDVRMHDAWNRYASADTYIAYVDKVRNRLVKQRGPEDPHVAWFTSRFPSNG